MTRLRRFRQADELLRGHLVAGERARTGGGLGSLVGFVVLCGLLYGAAMGCFGLLEGGGIRQLAYSALKVPLLLLVTFTLSVPSFFVLNTLLGLRADFPRALRSVAAAQAALTIVLVSLSPITLFWYACSADYQMAILFNAAMFGLASLGAQLTLRRGYRPLIEVNPRHRRLLQAWLLVYAFIGVQMGWVLRPFIGDPGQPTRFFRGGDWENAYVVVARLIWDVLNR